MSHSVTLLCRIDSLNDKNHIDKQVSTILRAFKKQFKGRKSQLTKDSQLERKFVFYQLTPADAGRLVSTSKKHLAQICMKSILVDPAISSAPTPPTSPVSSALSPNFSTVRVFAPKDDDDSPSSSTKRLVLNFGLDESTDSGGIGGDPSPSSTKSLFSSDSGSTSGSGVGVGTLVATPEVLLLRELAEIMKVSSVKATSSKIGKEVSKWFVTDRVQKIMQRII